MKLSEAQIALVSAKLGVQALDPEDEATKGLEEAFGEHTFYVDPGGLNIFEHSTGDAGESLALVQIAEWSDENRSSLRQIDPVIKPVYIPL